jgi:para-aminobenzoate synthetase/4-amino-4-deoxychorismate lyase
MDRCSQRPEPSRALLTKYARQEGFILLRDGPAWRLYRQPSEILIPTDVESLKQVLQRISEHVRNGGEAAGVLSYEAGYALEPRLQPLLKGENGPLAWFALYRSSARCEDGALLPGDDAPLLDRYAIKISWEKYRRRVTRIRQLIRAGEVYQINFTTRVRLQTRRPAWRMFCALCRRHPVPCAAFLNAGDQQVVSLSPELFFEIKNGRIIVRPMKGTADRGRYLEEDLVAAEALGNSEKNRAENVMIVDLLRNDLGRICRTGSVKTQKLFEVERYPSVWQMTSTVVGHLRADATPESIVTALFPSGSVTGAPKIRAMQHIAALEDSPRGVYTGAIGFFAPRRAQFNVAIRTLTLENRHGEMGVGGGITYDSVAAGEWEECRWKAAFLVESRPEFQLFETLYWNGHYRLLEAHLVRMRDSANYFGFAFNEPKARAELLLLAKRFPAKPHRVRIALTNGGQLEITHANFIPKPFGRIGVSRHTVSSQDRFLFHKTTNRELYARKYAVAQRNKFDDVLFFNERGELTEGAIHNVFVVKNGVWRTPELGCGLLPGTLRAEILKRRENACEAILRLKDLRAADEVYLCNSVRGIYSVQVQW